jgi:hypothetical protein
MIDIVICILGIIGILVCRIIENVMWEYDREKALGYEFKRYCGAKMKEGEQDV